MKQNNKEIKKKIGLYGLYQWQVAYQMGISENTLCRWLRFPLSNDKLNIINKAIDELIKEREN